MKFFLLLFISFTAFSVNAQIYIPVDTLNANQKELYKYFQTGTKALENEFKSFSVTDRKLIRNFVNSRNSMFNELTKSNYFFIDSELEDYLNGLLTEIAEANNIDSSSLRIFLSRDTDPNALSLGDGNFIFNLSLLHRLENEDELRFIIAHELAHYHLSHLQTRVETQMQITASKEYVSKKREIRRSRYNRFTKSLGHHLDFLYEDRNANRKRELEADSMGYVLVKNIITVPQHAVSALKKLDTLSPSEFYKIDLEMLQDHFSTASMPFNEEWLAGYDFSKYNYQRGKRDIFGVHKDSLLTHPDKEARLLNLKKIIAAESQQLKKEDDRFQKFKEKIRFENVYAHYCMEEYGRGIYLILQLQNSREIDEEEALFYKKMLRLFYDKLREARLAFTFKKYVDDVNVINYSEEYNLFLTILDNLRASELQELALNN